MEDRALLFDIYRGTTHDGPGMRSTAFFKGCPLSCRWCHNPEGIARTQAIWWEPKTCIGCMTCVNTCPHGAIIAAEDGLEIDRSLCDNCGACVEACPARAMTFIAKAWEMDELVKELCKDKAYYNQTSGGVTVSGGEVLLQADFVAELFKRLHQCQIHTALDTSGLAPIQTVDRVLEHTDCVLYDLKLMDSQQHKRFTGVDNALILENAKHIASRINSGNLKAEMWIRTPLIPDATATPDNIRRIGNFIAQELGDAVTRWEMCSFNNSCINKYNKLGIDWEYAQTPLMNRKEVNELLEVAKASGVAEERIIVTGIIHEDGKN